MLEFQSDGVRIAYRDQAGSRALPVLLIHGFASHSEMNWLATGWFHDLGKAGWRVIGLDNRGHGASEKLYRPEDYGANAMAGDALRLLDHLGIDRAHVVGYSMGARIAARLAIRHPERVARLILGGLGINMVKGMSGTGPIAHALEAASIDDVSNPTARTFRAFAEQTKSDLRALAACIRSGRDPVPAAELQHIQSPTLVAVGTHDVIAGSAAELAALIPGGRAFEIVDREHMKAVGDRCFKAAVLAFLAEGDGEAPRA